MSSNPERIDGSGGGAGGIVDDDGDGDDDGVGFFDLSFDFGDRVLSVVTNWIATGVVSIVAVIVGTVVTFWDVLASIPVTIADAVINQGLGQIVSLLLRMVEIIEGFAIDVVAASGPLAPLWISVLVLVGLFAISAALSTVRGWIPI